jgi:hypothetical protein
MTRICVCFSVSLLTWDTTLGYGGGHDLTSWSFKTLTNDPQGMQWFAEGDLIVGTKSCVGDAVKKLGGYSDGCSGPG